jgi:hypothetical protein
MFLCHSEEVAAATDEESPVFQLRINSVRHLDDSDEWQAES